MPLSGGGAFVNLLAKNNALTRVNATEDSCFAMILLIVASRDTVNYVQLYPFLAWARNRSGAAFQDTPDIADLRFIARASGERWINPFAIEFFAQGLFRRLGIPTASTRIVATREAASLAGDKWVLKFASRNPNRLIAKLDVENLVTMFDRDGFSLASQIVPDAATIDYIRRKLLPDAAPIEGLAATFVKICNEVGRGYQNFAEFTERVLGKEFVAADKLYENFRPSESELATISEAIRWNHMQYLKICAARIFIGCSAPHSANVLVTRFGKLISIDHTTAQFESGEDLQKFFGAMNQNSYVFRILRDVSELRESDIRAAVAEIPQHPACGSLTGLADYFVGRLRLWKELFSGRPAPVQEAAHSAA